MLTESLRELVTGIESAGNPVTLKVIELFRSRISAVQVTETPDEEVEALLTELISELQKALEPEPSTQNFTPEQLTQLRQIEKDHQDSVLTMDMFGLTPKARIPQPTIDQIRPKLTPEMLERVKYLHEPKLICVPTRSNFDTAIRFQELALYIDKAKADGKTDRVHTGELTLVNVEVRDGRLNYRKNLQWQTQEEYFKQSQNWEVWIVEGAEEMPDPAIDTRFAIDFPKNGTNQEKHDYMLAKYESLNLEGLTYETWIVLLMDALRKQSKIDANTTIYLLNNDLALRDCIAIAHWRFGRPSCNFLNTDNKSQAWRSRAAIRVM